MVVESVIPAMHTENGTKKLKSEKDEKMLPKIIHYCWFGRGQMPEMALKCITSWKKYCPDYTLKEWNEDNFYLDMYPYVREAYEARKFAFVTDVVRLYALLHEGGIYMDTDVEVIRPIDSLLQYAAVSGFETEKDIPTGLMAAEQGHPLFRELLEEYEGIHFVLSDGTYDMTPNVARITRTCLKYGFVPNNQMQTVHGFTLLPKDYLCPKSYSDRKIQLTSNSLCIHHFAGSWLPPSRKKKLVYAVFGKKWGESICGLWAAFRERNKKM